MSLRSTITYSGMDAMSSAASPDATCCSATTTSPLPHAASSTPTSAAVPNCGHVIRNPPGPEKISTATHNRNPDGTNRAPADRNGAIVSTLNRMARYVDPHTTYTPPSAVHASQPPPALAAGLLPTESLTVSLTPTPSHEPPTKNRWLLSAVGTPIR